MNNRTTKRHQTPNNNGVSDQDTPADFDDVRLVSDKPVDAETPQNPASKETKKPEPSVASNDQPEAPASDENEIENLLGRIQDLYRSAQAKEKELLYQRIEIGRILINLKDTVGHGNFVKEFEVWQNKGKIAFSHRTGERAMAYAELERDGKFVDVNKNSIVSNLADAERLRKDERSKNKEETKSTPPADNKQELSADAPLVELDSSRIAQMARKFATPILEECNGCILSSRRELLEELIEVLTEELEKIDEEIEP